MRRITASTSVLAAALALAAAGQAAAITAPPGVRVETFATGIPQATNIAFDARGRAWVTSGGNVTVPSDGVWFVPRRGARPVHVVKGIFTALGLTWYRNELYVSYVYPYTPNPAVTSGRVTAYGGFDGRRFTRSRTVLRDIPIGEHTMDSIVPGPDGRLYVGVGSKFDAQPSPNRISGSVVSVLPSGQGRRLEAYGLRNPYGLAFVPGTRTLLVTDNGRDDLGSFRPPDELNVVETGGPAPFLGFPGCYGQGGPACRGVQPPLAKFPPHASSNGIAVAERWGTFGLSAFVAQNGSSPQFSVRTGSNVVRVALAKRGGRWVSVVRPFAGGFRQYDPLGAGLGPDGSLYVTLWRSGSVVRFVPPRRPGS
jgi:glucose/arabinose dehydrogenase